MVRLTDHPSKTIAVYLGKSNNIHIQTLCASSCNSWPDEMPMKTLRKARHTLFTFALSDGGELLDILHL